MAERHLVQNETTLCTLPSAQGPSCVNPKLDWIERLPFLRWYIPSRLSAFIDM